MTTLDLSGLRCPQVVLRLADFLRDQPPGSRIIVVSTDPLSAIDIPYFLDRTGHVLIERTRESGRLVFVLCCGPADRDA